ncbi:DUF4625 domain-containing protein [Bizionia sp. KMM 8389]
MKILSNYFIFFLFILLASCSSDDSIEIDEEKPTITINYDGGFPQACEELVRGETYNFRAFVTDNRELAAYSLNIHHNFDHHTHDDQDETCILDPLKVADNPLFLIENYTIEEGLTSYEINVSVTIPIDSDLGDYHCSYSVTDTTGWQSMTSVDIKIVD